MKRDDHYNLVYRNCLKETIGILLIWAVFAVWVLGYSFLFGYGGGEGSVRTVMGIPHWVFWGVALPWFASAAVTVWFALYKMEEDDLDTSNDPSPKRLTTND